MNLKELRRDTLVVTQLPTLDVFPVSWLRRPNALVLNIQFHRSAPNHEAAWAAAVREWERMGTPVGLYLSGYFVDSETQYPQRAPAANLCGSEPAWYRWSGVAWHPRLASADGRAKPNRNLPNVAKRVRDIVSSVQLPHPDQTRFFFRDNLEPIANGGDDAIQPTLDEIGHMCDIYGKSAIINIPGPLSAWSASDVGALLGAACARQQEDSFLGLMVENADSIMERFPAEDSHYKTLLDAGIPLVLHARHNTPAGMQKLGEFAWSMASATAPCYVCVPAWIERPAWDIGR